MKLTVKNLDTTIDDLQGLYTELEDLRKPFTVIKAKMYKEIIRHFEEEEGPDGKWERWQFRGRRINYRPYGRGGNKMLQDTGRLRNSFMWDLLPDEIRVFTEVEYASYHQFGTSKMVARPFLWFEERSYEEWAEYIVEYLLRRLL